MVPLDIVHASNARLRELGPGLVALFVGGTSGIGEFTLKAFVQHADAPRVYLVGRNTEAAERIINDCKVLNKESKVEFLKADVSELAEVDRVCKELAKAESKINILVQTQGNLNMRGRDESPEGLDRKFTLNFYSRMRFISNLLPLLRTATTSPPHFSRTLSILGAGHESPIDLDDLELKNSFTGARCAAHTTVMNDFMMEEYAVREPGIAFLHLSPGVVNTGLARELPFLARAAMKVFTPVFLLFMTGQEETGERQLFHATSGMYPAAKLAESPVAGGVPLGPESSVGTGVDGKVGSGGYLVNWNGDITGKAKLLSDYRQKGVAKTVWEHTASVFSRVEKINKDREASDKK